LEGADHRNPFQKNGVCGANASAKLRRMSETLAATAPEEARRPLVLTFFRESVPSRWEVALAAGSAILLILAFPNFEFWWLAWIGLVPLLFAVATTSRNRIAFVLGLIWGTIFFYGTCWWLTYPMIHYGGVSAWLAYPLLLLPVVFVSVFSALACLCLSLVIKRFGVAMIFFAPIVWVAFDWLRGAVTGFDWNALGYSQAFHPTLIQFAAIGGISASTWLLVTVNAAVTFAALQPVRRSLITAALVLAVLAVIVLTSRRRIQFDDPLRDPSREMLVVGIQPNVPMSEMETAGYGELLKRHLQLSLEAFSHERPPEPQHRLVIWPESPMNFSYSRDPQLQNTIANFAQTHHTSVLLNSLEPAANGGSYNSAVLVNEQGQKVAQYDKIRLMPFGEYVPLPRWLPGSGSVRGIVGEFTPGSSYTLMPLGALRAGVFICIEAAHPEIARRFTNEGADVLINISNDGYLGPTAVMRQHLANAVFRAVENDRDIIRVTNSGISAYISSNGAVSDTTAPFQEAVRTWTISNGGPGSTFYSRHGDLFAYGCALITLGFISATFMTRRKVSEARP
jgi:apolipoprotein N-acyltransferase